MTDDSLLDLFDEPCGGGQIAEGPSSFPPKDRQAFANPRDRWLTSAKKGRMVNRAKNWIGFVVRTGSMGHAVFFDWITAWLLVPDLGLGQLRCRAELRHLAAELGLTAVALISWRSTSLA
ncbi:MAG: hypothetical protein EA424_19320 [Planctomycetaceae bacterium]|nr:MAG: hypothetical protein EA424_19320 [Planctomycetaceae bacterium]